MKTLFYSCKDFEKPFLQEANKNRFEVDFTEERLSIQTVALAKGYRAICIFTNDDASEPVLKELQTAGVKYIAVRAAGYDNIDLAAAGESGIAVANVPEYSPYAIAEHTVALILALNRKLIRANEQVHRQNFTVGKLIGFNLHQKKVGLIGAGRIGGIVARILHGFGCTVLVNDRTENQELISKYGAHYVGMHTLCSQADIISIHTPLTPETKYLIDRKLIREMKRGVMLINTARGGVVKTEDVVDGLKSGHIGYYGADVYENEKGLFFYDRSHEQLNDRLVAQLMGFENVLLTPHQAFATREALTNIATTTFQNIDCWANHRTSEHELTPGMFLGSSVN